MQCSLERKRLATGEPLDSYPAPPRLMLGIVDWGGTIDTQTFHQTMLSRPTASSQLREAIAAIRTGLYRSEPALIGWGATHSALAHQALLPKPGLAQLVQLVKDAGGYGLCVAHTGTVAGLLMDPDTDGQEMRRHCLRLHSGLRWLGQAHLCGGGVVFSRTTA
ncbi:MAG: hypothetical protein ACOX4G_00105 [Limnochordia bacterium]